MVGLGNSGLEYSSNRVDMVFQGGTASRFSDYGLFHNGRLGTFSSAF